MTLEKNVEIARLWFEKMWTEPNFETAHEIIDTNYNPEGVQIDKIGPEQVIHEIKYFRSVFPNVKFEIVEMNAEKEKVWVWYKGKGTHKGEGWGFKPTNKTVEFEGVTILYLNSDGKVSDMKDFFSFYDLFADSGAIPTLSEIHKLIKYSSK